MMCEHFDDHMLHCPTAIHNFHPPRQYPDKAENQRESLATTQNIFEYLFSYQNLLFWKFDDELMF